MKVRAFHLHIILNSIRMESECACHSESFIPNKLVKKLNGKKNIVTTVNSMIERPWWILISARLNAIRASIILACCCFRVRRSWSCD